MGEDRLRLLSSLLAIPDQLPPLAVHPHGSIDLDSVRIEKLSYLAERGSEIPANLYLPRQTPAPGLVLASGHGGSKSKPLAQCAGQLYARMGIACLVTDPIGEEERHEQGGMSTRSHDAPEIVEQLRQQQRTAVGKMTLDLCRGLEMMSRRSDIDAERLGVMGSSLGGFLCPFVAAFEPRVRLVLASGMVFGNLPTDKPCQSAAIAALDGAGLDWAGLFAAVVSHADVHVFNGRSDFFDADGSGDCWRETERVLSAAEKLTGGEAVIQAHYDPDPAAGHRHLHLSVPAVQLAMEAFFGPEAAGEVQRLPTVLAADWGKRFGLAKVGYGNMKDHDGAWLPDAEVRYLQPTELACSPEREEKFTLAGWLTGS